MPTETPTQPLRHAWAVVKYNAQSGDTENTGDAALALIEPGVHLLELAAAYRVAHAAFEAAPEGEHMEPLRLLEIARCTLLSAALGVLP